MTSIGREDYVMVTSSSVVNAVSGALDPRQMTQSAQPKANEKTAAEELKDEEQQQAENISKPRIAVANSSMDIRMHQIHQAAQAGILRPVWLEMMDMDANMPRMRDLIGRTGKNDEAANATDKARHEDNAERAADEARQAMKTERAAGEARQVANAERVAEGTERAVKYESAVDGSGRTMPPSE